MFSERIHKLLQPTPSIFTSWFWLPIPVNLPSGQQFAIENAIEIVDLNDLPIKNGGSFHSFLLVYQRVFQEALFWFSCGGAILKWICDFKCIGEPTQGKKKGCFSDLTAITNAASHCSPIIFQNELLRKHHHIGVSNPNLPKLSWLTCMILYDQDHFLYKPFMEHLRSSSFVAFASQSHILKCM